MKAIRESWAILSPAERREELLFVPWGMALAGIFFILLWIMTP